VSAYNDDSMQQFGQVGGAPTHSVGTSFFNGTGFSQTPISPPVLPYVPGGSASGGDGGQPASMAVDQQILHVVDHATYHRGQLNTMIRRAGGTPANTMYWSFVQAGRPRGDD